MDEQTVSQYKSNGVLLLPNKSIERNFAKNTKFFINKAFQQLQSLGNDLEDDALRFELKRNYAAVFSPYADKIAQKYVSEQNRYTNLTVNKIVEQVYQNSDKVEIPEEDNSKTYLLLLALIPFMFDSIEEEYEIVDIKTAVEIAKAKTFKRIDTLANKANYEDFLSASEDFLISRGITKAIWTSHDVGQHIRPSHHFIMNGTVYDLTEGLYDPDYGDYVQCGELNGCRCTPRILLQV